MYYPSLKSIPSLNLSYTSLYYYNLKVFDQRQQFQVFEALGYKELFSQNMNLTDLFEPGPPMYLEKLIHQAKVNVHENGTEASAATGAVADNSLPECTFHADHPFAYIIYDDANNFIHYMGILNTPNHK